MQVFELEPARWRKPVNQSGLNLLPPVSSMMISRSALFSTEMFFEATFQHSFIFPLSLTTNNNLSDFAEGNL